MRNRLSEARRRALKVAAASAGLVAVTLAIVLLVVDVAVYHSQVSHVDARLSAALAGFAGTGPPQPAQPQINDPEQLALSVPLVIWIVDSNGNVVGHSSRAPSLPSGDRSVTAATTISVNNSDFRISGGSARANGTVYHVVIGQSIAVVDASRDSLISIELWMAPLLVAVSFVGAFLVGARTADPIERSRQRQLAFAADASHELRTPLTVIEAESALALSRTRTATELTGSVERIATEAARLRHIVESLLWLARADAADAPSRAEPVDLASLATVAVQRFQPVADSRGINITYSAAETAVIVAAPEWADRLIGVLLDNACKYARANGNVRVTVASDAHSVVLRVEDDGPGIPEAQRSLIFNRFHRAVDGEAGAGLGLAIGDAVVTATKARWTVATSPDLGGALMSVTWPVASV